eukprot:CAMPEP_0201118572 /NCGR_PEP_ID=MMETSP0850-20130426/2777_1 /ASSEMBLY_ACC=CAM_ASM_000622 /TAXON_ID=183588 /ORGANISM="Pseudo-nitzschia fraudulenta, Strain WWA7" /LENGTH=570 /DNA_ID=CAMNT_0047383887 /DNA_START=213 /DNA_END=1925 /DNA_ORIENTATION=+
MNQEHDNRLNQGAFLERFLQEQQHQYQQKMIQQQLVGDGNRNIIEKINDIGDLNSNRNDGVFIGLPVGSISFPSSNTGTKSPAMGISNGMGLGINQQNQQNRMLAILQERQQILATGIVGGSSDLSPNLGISCLPANVGLDSRVGSTGIGTSIPSHAWMDGFAGSGFKNGTGSDVKSGGSLYPTEQDLILNSQRYPTLGGSVNSVGGNRLAGNGACNSSFGVAPLNSVLGGLPQFTLQHQNLTSAQASLNAHQKTNGKSLTDIIMAKQAQVALFEAAQAHFPRTIRLPCGARGMKADHNSTTAYFDVPENARHGQHLLCSHSVCRAAGVKFRYCFYCKKPVTKQNFRSRHLHANLDPNNKKQDEKEAPVKKDNKEDNTENKRKLEKQNDNSTSTQKLFRPFTDDDDKDSIESLAALPIINIGKESCCIESCSGTECSLERPSKICKTISTLDGEKLSRRQSLWAKLLEERPSDDLEAIHFWTGKVLSVSNPEIDTFDWESADLLEQRKKTRKKIQLEQISFKGLSGHWNSLLAQRPKGNSSSSSVTKWLIQALEISDVYKKMKRYKFDNS